MDNRENEPYPKSERPRPTHAEWRWPALSEIKINSRHPVMAVVRRQTVLAQRAEDSAGRAAWFPGLFASVTSVRYRIPGIAEHGAVAPKGPKQISPGQSAAPPRVREARSRQALKGRHRPPQRLFRPFRACSTRWIGFPGRRRRSHRSRRLAPG